jgi:putative inorganic carbon (hco3(-)) transporter
VSDRPALVWRSTPLRLALAALPLWFTLTILRAEVAWTIKLLVTAVFAVSAVSPASGLIAVAAIAPFGRFAAAGLHSDPLRISEAVVLAFFAGWVLLPRADAAGPRTPGAAGWALAAVVALSIAAQAWRLLRFGPGDFTDVSQLLARAYYPQIDSIGLQAGARFFEGLGLAAAAATLCRRRPWLATTLLLAVVASASAAAAASYLVTKGIAPALILAEHAVKAPRTSAHVGDVNAAASYFALTLLAALGAAASTRPFRAVPWIVAAGALAWALSATGSRTGIAAAAIATMAAATIGVAARSRPGIRRAVLVVGASVIVAAAMLRAGTMRRDAGAAFRRDFVATSVRMIAARPLSGLGVGQYYEASSLFLSPFLGWTYGFENAHNNFLQVGAELGVPGVAAFLALLAIVLARAGIALLRQPHDARLLGVTGGVAAFLITCLAGHPLLTDEVAYTFWLTVGLVTALTPCRRVVVAGFSPFASADVASATVVSGFSRTMTSGFRATVASGFSRASLAIAAALVSLLFVWTGSRPVAPSESTAVTGLERWESDADGTRYRWTGEYASVFVPRQATRVYISLRQPVQVPQLGAAGVGVHIYGADHGRMIVGPTWAVLNVQLPIAVTQQHYKRIDLKVDRAWQPAVYVAGSADMRTLGVQVGEMKLFFEY